VPTLLDLLTPAEVDLLRLVPTLPVPLGEFLGVEVVDRFRAHVLLATLLKPVLGDCDNIIINNSYGANSIAPGVPEQATSGYELWLDCILRKGTRPKATANPLKPSIGDRPNVDDPAVRLAVVNAMRQRQGLPPLSLIPPVVNREDPSILGAGVSGSPPWPKQPSRSAILVAMIAAWDEGGRVGPVPTLRDVPRTATGGSRATRDAELDLADAEQEEGARGRGARSQGRATQSSSQGESVAPLPRRPAQNPLDQPQRAPRPRQASRNPLGEDVLGKKFPSRQPSARTTTTANPLGQAPAPRVVLKVGDLVVTLKGNVRRITGISGHLVVLDGSVTYDRGSLRLYEGK
jgi:hypothetical protein